jgi:hypothetical protein
MTPTKTKDAAEPMVWSPVHNAGSWGIATTDTPADLTAALALPGSWPIDKTRLLVRRDQWGNLPTSVGPPLLASMDPAFGPVTGADPVVLTGSRLTGTTMVFFGSNQATGLNVISDTSVACVSPPGAAGLVNVSALRGVASNAIQYEYRDAEDPGEEE